MFDIEALILSASTVIAAWMPRVLGALGVFVLGLLVARWTKDLTRGALGKSKADPRLAPFISGVLHVGLIVLVAIAAVNTLGVSTTSFVAVLGAAGLAVALAFQDTFSNFAAGVMLLTGRLLGDPVGPDAGAQGEPRGVWVLDSVSAA